MSLFEIFALVQNWYEGNRILAASCLAAHSLMTVQEAYAYLDEHQSDGLSVMIIKIVQDLDEIEEVISNLKELDEWLNDVINQLIEHVDEHNPKRRLDADTRGNTILYSDGTRRDLPHRDDGRGA